MLRRFALLCAVLLAALPALAQPQTFYAVLSGKHVVAPVTTTGFGDATLTVDMTTGAWTASGAVWNLESDFREAKLFQGTYTDGMPSAPAGALTLQPSIETGLRSGTLSGAGTFSAYELGSLRAGQLTLIVYTQNRGAVGELRDQLRPVAVDGRCGDARYALVAGPNPNLLGRGLGNGFGTANDLDGLYAYADGRDLYVCLQGELEGNGNGFMLHLDFSGYQGLFGSNAIPENGPSTTGSTLFPSIGGMKMDAGGESDWVFFANRQGTTVHSSIARLGTNSWISNPNGAYLGAIGSNDVGIAEAFVVSETGTGRVSYAYQQRTDSTANPFLGYEVRFPISAFAGVSASEPIKTPDAPAAFGPSAPQAPDNVTFFAAISSADGYVSNEILPYWGVVNSANPFGNPGYDFDLSANSPSATLWAGNLSLPVELVSFTGTASGTSARLAWTTASETNNTGFVVERQTGTAWTDASALIAGRGTTTERHDYSFTATGLTAGRHSFRLRQIDTDGTVHYSATASVEIGVEGEARVTLLGSRAVRIETNASQGVTVSVYDVLGRSVSSQDVSVEGTGIVELPSLASGAYVVRVEGERFAASRTLVVR